MGELHVNFFALYFPLEKFVFSRKLFAPLLISASQFRVFISAQMEVISDHNYHFKTVKT